MITKRTEKEKTKPRDFVFFWDGVRDSETRKNPTKRRGRTERFTLTNLVWEG